MTEPVPPTASFESADQHLRKTMKFRHLLGIQMTGILGSGWLFGCILSAAIAGPASVVAWVIGGLLVFLIMMPYMEISAMLPRSGSIVRYPQLTHGGYTGFLMGWAYLIYALATPAIESIAVLTYLTNRFPQAHLTSSASGVPLLTWPTGIGCGLGMMLVFFLLNYYGIRLFSEVSYWLAVYKVAVPSLTFVLLLFAFRGSNFVQYNGFAPFGVAPIFQVIATGGIVFTYTGFRQAMEYGGEVENPQRNIPLASILGLGLTMLMFIGLEIGFVGVISFHNAGIRAGDWAGLMSSSWATQPLYSALTSTNMAVLGAFGTVLLIDAAVSPGAAGLLTLGTATRSLYGMSIGKFAHKGLQESNRYGIPWISLVLSTVIGALVLFPFHGWNTLMGLITSAAVITYMMGGLGLPVLRRVAPNLARPFRLRAPRLLSLLAFLAADMVLYWAGFRTLITVFALTFAGLALFAATYAPAQGWVSRRAGVSGGIAFLVLWLLVNLLGGWFLNVGGPARSSIGLPVLGFPADYVLMVLLVVAFSGILWTVGGPRAHAHLNGGWWFIGLSMSDLLVSYLGEYGPLKNPLLGFPESDLIVLGLGVLWFFVGQWGGFKTDEVDELLAARQEMDIAEPSGR